jgi:trehalose 6-phosphate phosphatase
MAPVVESLAAEGTLIVLDFDGTLAPIVGDRRAAALPKRGRAVLARLAHLYPVAVLSGRAAPDVQARLEGAPVKWVVGSHGAEWPGEERDHRAWRSLVGTWRAALAPRLAAIDGVDLEEKPLSLAVHYRRARDERAAVSSIAQALTDLVGVSVVLGKKVVNLVPEGAGDKGTALRRLVGLAGAKRVLFIGDDVTDEAAFGASLDVPAVMVRVGRDPSSKAGAWLRRRTDVEVLLERLCALRSPPRPRATPRPPPRRAQAPAGGVLGPALEFMQELWRLEQGLNRCSKAMLTRHGVSGPQRLLVRVVGRLGPITPASLARVLHLHPSSVTRLVHKLEARSFVRRTQDPAHRGRHLLVLGSRGGRIERLAGGTVESAVRAALSKASARDVEATRRVIERITQRLTSRR